MSVFGKLIFRDSVVTMIDAEKRIKDFVSYVATLDGDEKGEAQVFCDRLFRAFGWPGYKEAGARLESRVAVSRKDAKKTTKFADLVWPSDPTIKRVGCLFEMKRRGEKLENHYRQAFEYWQFIVPHRPRYVVLCNFDDFWIYDFDLQLYEPVDRVKLTELPDRYPAFNFLFPEPKKPQFGNDRIAVTREAANKVAGVFNRIVARGVDRGQAQRFILQCVVCLFSEDISLLPKGLFTEILDDCVNGRSSYDLIGELFRWMDNKQRPQAGRFKGVRHFNGGLFFNADAIELTQEELASLHSAATENWSKVHPAIFGTLFQSSMDKEERHALGAHFTSEADIQKVILPTIVKPWRERIAAAETRESLEAIRSELERFQVLDPACGSGNFLYVAYRELVRVEMELVTRLRKEYSSAATGKREITTSSFINIQQFRGIDISEFAIELAKVTMLLAKKLAYDEVNASLLGQLGLSLMKDPLPLDNLDDYLICKDALFCEWPQADAIIGNPPYQAKNKMQKEFGASYVHRVREKFADVPGRADYCVYWFRRTHDELTDGGRAGLVGTNTIRQNYSRQGGLDYIVEHGGTIVEAVGTQVWSGEAVVHVSIVNWIKGQLPGKKLLVWQDGDQVDSPWKKVLLDEINSSLSPNLDLSSAKPLKVNSTSGACYQGQTHGHDGFLLSVEKANELISHSANAAEVIHPFLIGDDLLGRLDSSPSRWVIDFSPRDMHAAAAYKEVFAQVRTKVLQDRQKAASAEAEENNSLLETNPTARVNHHHRNFLAKWWLLSWPRGELLTKLSKITRYIVCVRVTKRPIFEFVCSAVHPNDALQVFTLSDDYSFGILQSAIHWQWFIERCSTLKRDFRYTSDTVFDPFPWPQSPTLAQVRQVAAAAVDIRKTRRTIMASNGLTLRALYRQLEDPGKSPMKAAQEALDSAVRAAYGMGPKESVLSFLLNLNFDLTNREGKEKIVGPGLPPCVLDSRPFVTGDCVKVRKSPV